MRRETIVVASVLAIALGLAACTTPAPGAQMAQAAKPKPKYDPAFQNAFDALNHPAIGFSSPGPRSPLGR